MENDLFTPKAFAIAKKKMYALRTNEMEKEFFDIFSSFVENGTWVSAPANDNQLLVVNMRGGCWIAIYSSMEARVRGESKDVITTDINKFIDVVYDNPRLMGIVVDPNKEPYLISRKTIHQYTKRKDSRLQIRDWGSGIPNFNKDDIMVEEELLDFGIDIILEHYLSKQSCQLIEENRGVNGFPNIVYQKNNQLYMMKVFAGVLPNRPTCTKEQKEFYISHCNKFNAKCVIASVSIGSSDEERKKAGLALVGDGYNMCINEVVELN